MFTPCCLVLILALTLFAFQYWTHDDGGAIELFDGRTPVTNASCTDFPNGNANSCPVKFYSADLFTTRAIDIIQAVAEEDTPMFMYLAYQSVSGGFLMPCNAQLRCPCIAHKPPKTPRLHRSIRRTKPRSTLLINSITQFPIRTAERLPVWWRRLT